MVFLSKKKKTVRYSIPRSSKSDEYYQTIELLIDLKGFEKRYLQEEEKIQILGKNFEEINSINSVIYIDDKKVAFDKYISIKSSSIVKVVIKFLEKKINF